MIRHTQGNDFLLVTQHDHARLAGRLAAHAGNEQFQAPSPRGEWERGVAMHDCGWPVHDDAPTLSRAGLPLHVLEVSMPVATAVWGESARRAAESETPYAALLVSLHVMYLSGIAQRHDATPHERYENRHDLFLLNQFQQNQSEHQERLRKQVGLRTDLPLRLGLAKRGVDPAEDRLAFDYGWLKAMDAISLDACCSEDLFPKLDSIATRPGDEPTEIRVHHGRAGEIALDPWPFGVPRIELSLPARRVPGRAYANEAEFREVYAAAAVEEYTVRVSPMYDPGRTHVGP